MRFQCVQFEKKPVGNMKKFREKKIRNRIVGEELHGNKFVFAM